MTIWHRQEIDEILAQLGTDSGQGLTSAEAEQRLAKFGPNELVERGGKTIWALIWEQLVGVMTILLIVSAIVSLFLKDYEDAIAILAIVVLNTILGFTQEFRAEKAMAALKQMAVPHIRVRRDGIVKEITARSLVPGDIVLLEAGNLIPADGRLIESANLRIQEAVLTGESVPVEKTVEPLPEENLALGDQRNRVFMGTVIAYGRGVAIVTETGMRTELGKIASLLQGVKQEATPLQRRLEQLAKSLAIAALGVVAIVFIVGLLRGNDLRLMFLTGISLAVAAVPEGLPTVVTIGLALGAQRMLARNALIRKLPAVETLGSVTVICSDKTGTLTENRMTVTFLDVANHQLDLRTQLEEASPTLTRESIDPSLAADRSTALLLASGSLCNDALLEPSSDDADRFTAIGDPTEGALVIAAARAGLWKDSLEEVHPRRAELPFDSERKRMTTIHQLRDGISNLPVDPLKVARDSLGQPPYLGITKGAVDGLLEISSQVWNEGEICPLDEGWRERIRQANNSLAQNGMRILGVAIRPLSELPGLTVGAEVEQDLIFIGLIGMIDPARPEAKGAVQAAHSAGIRPIMITGDHPLTALAIASELGITQSNHVLTGIELSNLSTDELSNAVADTSVFARVSPEHKLKIVEALQARGEIVAMTGDGVNDAPALKKAEIGVAMGINGTDVSKESADMVLLDDNFATIVAAIEEGRRIYDNIRKFIRYILGSNVGEILVMLVGPIIGMPLPLLPLQILWVNLVTDGLPGLALTVEPAERNTMKRPPYPPQENIFSRGLGVHILWVGPLLALVTLVVAYLGWRSGSASWQTMAFTTLTLGQMGHVLSIRSVREPIFKIGFFSNLALIGAVVLTIVLQLAVVYLPFLQGFFSTVGLSAGELLICFLAGSVIFFAVEIYKRLALVK